jgi:hypothetical protein
VAITFQLTKTDLREALAADLRWTALDAKADPLSRWFTKVSFWVIGAAVGIGAVVEGSPIWQVHAWSLLSATLWPACVLLIVAAQSLLRSRRGALIFSGVSDAPAPQPGGARGRVLRIVILWVVFLALVAFIGYLQTARVPRRFGAASPNSGGAGVEAASWNVPTAALLGWSFLPLIAGSVLLAAAQRRLRLNMTERANFTVYEPRTLQIDDEGITVLDAHGHVRTKWSGFRQFMETEQLILVYPSGQSFHAFPKRDLQQAGQLDVLLMLLRERVPRGVVQWQPPGGFPVQMTGAAPAAKGQEGNPT